MSNTYKHYPKNHIVKSLLRYPRHRQQLAAYYGALADGSPKVRIQSEIIKEGAWADQWISSADYSERKIQGALKQRYLTRRRKKRKNHPRNTWLAMSAGDNSTTI